MVRTLEPRPLKDLAYQALAPDRRADLRSQHLQRALAVVLEVARQEDDGHSPAPQLALDHEPALEACWRRFVPQSLGERRPLATGLRIELLTDALDVLIRVAQSLGTFATRRERRHESNGSSGLQRGERRHTPPPANRGPLIAGGGPCHRDLPDPAVS